MFKTLIPCQSKSRWYALFTKEKISEIDNLIFIYQAYFYVLISKSVNNIRVGQTNQNWMDESGSPKTAAYLEGNRY